MEQLDLFTNNFKITDVGLEVSGEPDFEEWMDYGQSLKQLDGTARQFAIGDWICGLFKRYEHGKWDAVQQIWGEEELRSLREYELVAKRIECGTRAPQLSWTHHRVVANAELHPRAMDLLEQEKALKTGARREWGENSTQLGLI